MQAAAGAAAVVRPDGRELWGLSMIPGERRFLVRCTRKAAQHYHAGQIWPALAWWVYQLSTGQGVGHSTPRVTPSFLELDDFTEDFDFPEDLDRWLAARARSPTDPDGWPLPARLGV